MENYLTTKHFLVKDTDTEKEEIFVADNCIEAFDMFMEKKYGKKLGFIDSEYARVFAHDGDDWNLIIM